MVYGSCFKVTKFRYNKDQDWPASRGSLTNIEQPNVPRPSLEIAPYIIFHSDHALCSCVDIF